MTSKRIPPRASLTQSLIDIIKKHGAKDFAEAKEWFTKSHIENAEEDLVIKIAEALANNLSDGLVELSIEQVKHTEKYEGAIQTGQREITVEITRDLPTISSYVEFVFKYGSLEIATVRYDPLKV